MRRLRVSTPLREEKTNIRAVNVYFLERNAVIFGAPERVGDPENLQERLYFQGLVHDGLVIRQLGERSTKIEWDKKRKDDAASHFARLSNRMLKSLNKRLLRTLQQPDAVLVEIEWK